MPDDWFSPGLQSLTAQQPMWPVPQGWQNPPPQPLGPSNSFDERWGSMNQLSNAEPQPHDDPMSGPAPPWLNNLGQGLSDFSSRVMGGDPQDYLGAISLAKVGQPTPWGDQRFHMMNEQGQRVGDLEAHMEGDMVKVDWEGGAGGPNKLGFANSRSVLPELMREFPGMKRFTAYRISGARHGPAAQYKGPSGSATDIPYMTPVYNVPAHVKPNPPNQWSGKWLHEDSGKWYNEGESPPQRRIFPPSAGQNLMDWLREQRMMSESENEEVPQDLSNRVLQAARAREAARAQEPEPVNTPEELRNLDQNLRNWQAMQNRFAEQSRVGTVRTPPAPPAPPAPPMPQPEIASPNFGPRYGIPTSQQTPGPFTAQPMGQFQEGGREQAIGMGSLYNQPINLQMMSDQLQQMRQGYGGAGSQRMEEE